MTIDYRPPAGVPVNTVAFAIATRATPTAPPEPLLGATVFFNVADTASVRQANLREIWISRRVRMSDADLAETLLALFAAIQQEGRTEHIVVRAENDMLRRALLSLRRKNRRLFHEEGLQFPYLRATVIGSLRLPVPSYVVSATVLNPEFRPIAPPPRVATFGGHISSSSSEEVSEESERLSSSEEEQRIAREREYLYGGGWIEELSDVEV